MFFIYNNESLKLIYINCIKFNLLKIWCLKRLENFLFNLFPIICLNSSRIFQQTTLQKYKFIHKFSMGISNNITLENLQIRKDILKKFDIPLVVL